MQLGRHTTTLRARSHQRYRQCRRVHPERRVQGQPQTRSLLDTTVTEFSISPGAQRFLQGSRGEQALTNHVEFLNRGRAEPDPHLVARCAEAQGQLTGDQVRSTFGFSFGFSLRFASFGFSFGFFSAGFTILIEEMRRTSTVMA